MQLGKPISSDQSAKIAICQSRRLGGTSRRRALKAMLPAGTARKLALGQPNVVPNTDHTLAQIHDAPTTISMTVEAAQAQLTKKRRSSPVAIHFLETRRF
jgi:hypothetical protein